ncbi:MAG: sensor histidine kinase, partial [Pseudolabrys sp.]
MYRPMWRERKKGTSSVSGEFSTLQKGEVASLIRQLDWPISELGPFSAWPDHLKATMRLIQPAKAQIVIFWGPDYIALYNDAYAPTIGNKHPSAFGRPARENWAELWSDLEPLLRSVRETGETIAAKDRPFYIERHGYPETAYFDISYSAIRDDAGKVDGVLCIVSETTDRVLSQSELTRAQDRLARALGASGMIGTFDWNIDANVLHFDDRFGTMFSQDTSAPRDNFVFADHLAAVHADDIDRIEAASARCLEAGTPFTDEYRIRANDGTLRWIDVRAKYTDEGNGRNRRFSGVAVDITDRKEAEDHERLLLREMNHRVKNLLAVMDGMIALSARSAKTAQDMSTSLRGRLRALIEAKELVRPGTLGMVKERLHHTTLESLVGTILRPYNDDKGDAADARIIARGPAVELGENTAMSLALILHESSTNALKYGALSGPGGRL